MYMIIKWTGKMVHPIVNMDSSIKIFTFLDQADSVANMIGDNARVISIEGVKP